MTYPHEVWTSVTSVRKLLFLVAGSVASMHAQSLVTHTAIEVSTIKLNTGGG